MTTIYQISEADRALIAEYTEADNCRAGGPIGEIFADENCSVLVDDWREIAERVIARCGA